MIDVRIQPISERMISVDIVCDCGRNGLMNEFTGERSFHHSVLVNAQHPSESPTLRCECGKRYCIVSQRDHIHIRNVTS